MRAGGLICGVTQLLRKRWAYLGGGLYSVSCFLKFRLKSLRHLGDLREKIFKRAWWPKCFFVKPSKQGLLPQNS